MVVTSTARNDEPAVTHAAVIGGHAATDKQRQADDQRAAAEQAARERAFSGRIMLGTFTHDVH